MHATCKIDSPLLTPKLTTPSINLYLSVSVIWLFFNFCCSFLVLSNQASNDTAEPDNQQSRKRRDTDNKMLVSSKNLVKGAQSRYSDHLQNNL